MDETEYLKSSPAMMEIIRKGREEIAQGKGWILVFVSFNRTAQQFFERSESSENALEKSPKNNSFSRAMILQSESIGFTA